MARVDKTDSAVGVVRANFLADFVVGDYDKVIAVGLDSLGRIIKGSGQTGIVGVVIPGRNSKAGKRGDIFVLADVVDCVGLAAGTKYFGQPDGTVSTLNTGVALGFTVEADRLQIRL